MINMGKLISNYTQINSQIKDKQVHYIGVEEEE